MKTSLSELPHWHGGFPAEHEFSTLNGLETKPSNPELEIFMEAATKLIEQWKGKQFAGLYLYGPPGNGKTHAAIGLGRELHEKGSEVHYRYVPQHANDEVDLCSWLKIRGTTIQGDPMGPFPISFLDKNNPAVNMPRVLILDDFQPAAMEYVHSGIEAAAQKGGLVIVTSNYPDPFKLTEPQPEIPNSMDIIFEDMAAHVSPERFNAAKDATQNARNEQASRIASRIAAGFKFIPFNGEDRRMENSFWR